MVTVKIKGQEVDEEEAARCLEAYKNDKAWKAGNDKTSADLKQRMQEVNQMHGDLRELLDMVKADANREGNPANTTYDPNQFRAGNYLPQPAPQPNPMFGGGRPQIAPPPGIDPNDPVWTDVVVPMTQYFQGQMGQMASEYQKLQQAVSPMINTFNQVVAQRQQVEQMAQFTNKLKDAVAPFKDKGLTEEKVLWKIHTDPNAHAKSLDDIVSAAVAELTPAPAPTMPSTPTGTPSITPQQIKLLGGEGGQPPPGQPAFVETKIGTTDSVKQNVAFLSGQGAPPTPTP